MVKGRGQRPPRGEVRKWGLNVLNGYITVLGMHSAFISP